MRWRVWTAAALSLIAAVLLFAWWRSQTSPEPTTARLTRAPGPLEPVTDTVTRAPVAPHPASGAVLQCDAPAAAASAAARDAQTLATAAWSPGSRPETGWAAYAPLAAHEVGAACPPGTAAFTAALAGWRRAQGLAASDAAMDEATLKAMWLGWLRRRPFVQATARGECPPAPAPTELAQALPGETLGGKPVLARPLALEAWRRLRQAARAEVPALAADPSLLAIASGFRGPEEEAARCAEGGCDRVARARCSAHRTGTAFDLVLERGMRVSTDDANRAALARTPAYRWLVTEAGRFGFVPYAFEPWHWEWTGAATAPADLSAPGR